MSTLLLELPYWTDSSKTSTLKTIIGKPVVVIRKFPVTIEVVGGEEADVAKLHTQLVYTKPAS